MKIYTQYVDLFRHFVDYYWNCISKLRSSSRNENKGYLLLNIISNENYF